ncbi:MAG: hypothetical protein CM15mP25_0600 [Gammaproteobacteria bacterium]|nr:MAG: hypothetical protein CM15mP25_0600 [Gammaproteobacteria bacterium]
MITRDADFLARYFPVVSKAIAFCSAIKVPRAKSIGQVDPSGGPLGDALVTGCSSIYKSLECAILIADQLETRLQRGAKRGLDSGRRCGIARSGSIAPGRVNPAMRWIGSTPSWQDGLWASRLKIDWQRWSEFVEPGIGCRCENHQPWATVAESCELTLALLAAGERDQAAELFSWLTQWRDSDGAWWTGYQFAEQVLWPKEKPTWTAGAVLLAVDALTHHTAASGLFLSPALKD